MKKNLTKLFTTIAVAAILVVGVSYVSAWTAPTIQPPATGTVKSPSGDTASPVFASINEGLFDQIKKGGLIINEANEEGRFVSPLAFFKKALLPNADTSVYVGGSGAADPNFTTSFPDNRSIPLYVNTTGRNNNAVKVLADRAEQCPVGTQIITDSSAFQFWNTTDGKHADLLAKGIKLSGGNPAKGKILISVDANGNAVWATPRLAANGVDIIFDTTTSPVGNCEVPPTPTDLCANIDGTQTTLPPDTTQSGSDCVCNIGYTMSGDGVCIDDGDSLGAPPIGCFLADTQVTLADGSKKDIQDVKVGDRLKAVSGINTVQKLLRPILNDNPAYSINGSDAFFTANHPFLTTDGWKSLDPETTRKEIPELKVSLMNVGDVLVTESGTITIHSITPANQPANTQLYNFELNGDHTYYANGYAVHNKEQVPSNNPNPSCDFNTSTPRSDCTELNWYYCAIPTGNTQGQCIPSRICTTDAQCASGPIIGSGSEQIQLVNGRCLLPISAVHPADQGKKFCYWN